ncbi:gamma-glutamylcyclotransferase [Tamlana sp. I1]|uniref:gamma-glutamylcyclotransferase family protein n=1 Tax=Tamlana sp. I1 TaxID=2762061 RepID=UPI00188E9013|nr:gamma-glutamylcyclotransferase family protein [Tamlana sp. I1]
MKPDYLFVYGTLLKGVKNDMSRFLAAHAQFVAKGTFQGKLYQVSWYPGAVVSANASEKVYGAVFKIDDFENVFKVLDHYEGIGHVPSASDLFKRESVQAVLVDGTTIETWVYLYNRDVSHLKWISSGDFLKFSNEEV